MTYEEYIEDPSHLMGNRIKRVGNIVHIGENTLEFATEAEAREADAALECAKFAFGISDKTTKYRQTFAFGEGQNTRQTQTGWTKTS